MSANTQTQAEATETGRRQQEATGSSHGERFRPVALPALAAACLARPKAVALAEARPAATRRGILEMVHEDAPIL